MNFDYCNWSLKIRKSIKNPTSKVGVTWECVGSFPHTLLYSQEHEMWVSGFTLDRTFVSPCLVVNPSLGLWHIVFFHLFSPSYLSFLFKFSFLFFFSTFKKRFHSLPLVAKKKIKNKKVEQKMQWFIIKL
jgi:hypothetical protein